MTNTFSTPAPGESAPSGYEIVTRSAIVRLGPDLGIWDATNHACLGVVSVDVDGDHNLVVVTDFDDDTELCLSATANVDATLAAKGIFAGASGGGELTLFKIYSARTLPYGTQGHTYAAWTQLSPASSVFDSTKDNFWIEFKSLRQLPS